MAMRLTLAFAFVAVSSAAVVGKHQNFLGNGMQPEVVAKTLSSVEEEWKAQAAVFAECNGTFGEDASSVKCADAPSSFDKSCNTVVAAIIQGSGGDKDVTKEYMNNVCSQKSISGWHQEQCNALALAVQTSMTADKYENRVNFNSGKLCSNFWSSFLEKEKARVQKEKADLEAAEKKAAEEAAERERVRQEEAKKEAEAAEVAAKETAAKEAELQKIEEQKRVELEAKVKAAESAANLAQKKAEAEAVAAAAQKKKEEAEAAEKEQIQAMATLTAVNKTAPVEAPKESVTAVATNASAVEQKVEHKFEPTNETAAATIEVKNSNSTVAAVNTTK